MSKLSNIHQNISIKKVDSKTVNIQIFKNDLLLGTSGKNQFRWHLGYHYPRSNETIKECKQSYKEFNKYLGKSKILSQNYYAISKNDSNINFTNYLKILKKII